MVWFYERIFPCIVLNISTISLDDVMISQSKNKQVREHVNKPRQQTSRTCLKVDRSPNSLNTSAWKILSGKTDKTDRISSACPKMD